MEKPIKCTFISTPGHGYLSVNKRDFLRVLKPADISSFSGMSYTRVYLEEDCDASIFERVAKEKGIPLDVRETCRDNLNITHNYNSKLFDYRPTLGDVINEAYIVVRVDSDNAVQVHGINDNRRYKIPKTNPFKYILEVLKT